MPPAELLRGVVERRELGGHHGRSGIGLERVRLADGRVLVVKRVVAADDLTLRLTAGSVAREHTLRESGVLDRFPPGVSHPVVDTWLEDDVTVVVMRDLGSSVLHHGERLTPAQATTAIRGLAAMHRSFLADPPAEPAALERVLTLFAPQSVAGPAAEGDSLCAAAQRGWAAFVDLVPAEVAEAVLALLDDVAPLAAGLRGGPVTLVHGDSAIPNMALEGDTLVLFDWALATVAPGAVDVVRLLAECAPELPLSNDDVIDVWVEAAGPAHDRRSLELAVLSGLLWLGWNIALVVTGHSDPAVRAREVDNLAWWVRRARSALEAGLG